MDEEKCNGNDDHGHQGQFPTSKEHDSQKHKKPWDVSKRPGDTDDQGVLENIQIVGETRNEISCFGTGEERKGKAHHVVEKPLTESGNEPLDQVTDAVVLSEEEDPFESEDNDQSQSNQEILFQLGLISIDNPVHNVFGVIDWCGGEDVETHHADQAEKNQPLVGQDQLNQPDESGSLFTFRFRHHCFL